MIAASMALRASVFVLLAACVSAQGRVVVIGVDGMDYALTKRFMAEGVLPELSRLAAEGGFGALDTTNPAQSPVAWATIMTGLNPGKTGAFDFLKRTTSDGEIGAELALVEKVPLRLRTPVCAALGALAVLLFFAGAVVGRRGRRRTSVVLKCFAGFFCVVAGSAFALAPSEVATPRNPRGGRALWERADDAGVRATSLFAPLSFPAPPLRHGHLLCGLGVPDVAGTPGLATLWREGPVPGGGRITPTGCRELPLTTRGDDLPGAYAEGPLDAKGRRVRSPLALRALRDRRRVAVRTDGAAAEIGEGEWTPWMPASYDVVPFFPLHGLARFRLLEGGARTTLYQEPTCFDPLRQSPLAPVTSPTAFGAAVYGGRPFDTLGWACATNALQDELIDEATFLSDVEELDRVHAEMVLWALEDRTRPLFLCVLATPDRVQHLFWRDYDPAHARHDPAAIARRGDPIRAAYARVDALVGRIRRERLAPGDVLLVVSDHGFASFRTAVNLNRWLAEEGYLVGTGAPEADERTIEKNLRGSALFPGIDWSKTRAYSLGLGKIYVNLAGREPQGSVRPEERDALLAELRTKLLALRDGERKVVRSARSREEIYRGDRVGESADLVVGFEDGFRISWQATLGSLAEPVFAPNRARWSGDHCSVDPELVPGVFFASKPFEAARVDATDVFPTVEAALGLSATPGVDGRAVRWKAP